MGWRISLYRLPKQTADKWKNITDEQYHTEWDKMYDELHSECIFYDTLTDIICEDRDKKLHSDFFINDIDTNESAFIAISKEQFLDIIEEVRQRIIWWFDGRKVNYEVDNVELGDYWKNPTSLYSMRGAPWTADSAMKENQKEWNNKANHWKTRYKGNESDTGYHYLNIDLHSKWKVSGGWSYEYLIFDLIHIYKIFDWDNDVLLAIGG